MYYNRKRRWIVMGLGVAHRSTGHRFPPKRRHERMWNYGDYVTVTVADVAAAAAAAAAAVIVGR